MSYEKTKLMNLEDGQTLLAAVDGKMSNLKSALNYTMNNAGLVITPGNYNNNDIVIYASDYPAGTVVLFKITAQEGKTGYLDVIDTNGQRIEYLGKGSSTGGGLVYEQLYVLPTNYSYVKVGTNGTFTINYIIAENKLSSVPSLIKTINLYDVNTISSNKALNTSGTYVDLTGGFCTDYIDISLYSKIIITKNMGTHNFCHVFYSKEKAIITSEIIDSYGAIDGTGELMLNIPDGAYYVRFSGLLKFADNTYIYALIDISKINSAIKAIKDFQKYEMTGNAEENKYMTVLGSGYIQDYPVTGCGFIALDISSLVGKKIYVTTEKIDSPYNVFYIIANNNGESIDILNTGEFSKIDDYEVTVPNNANIIYVNYKMSAGEPVVSIIGVQESIEYIVQNNYPESKIYGKSIVTYGDSLTWYDGHVFTWGDDQGKMCYGFQTYLRNHLKMVTTNRGDSGKTTPQFCASLVQAVDLDTFDYMTIMGGDNDHRLGVTVGSLQPVGGTFDTSTVYGALQNAIEYALNENPNIRIILMTEPMGWTYRDGNMQRVSDLIPNAYRRVAELYGLPIIDNWYKSGVNELTRNDLYCDPDDDENTDYMYHPNNKGWARISKIICNEMKDK